MDKIYAASSSKKVKNLEGDLAKELKELKNEIEDSNFLSRPNANGGKSFSSVAAPQDIGYFRNERRLALENSLSVREAMPLLMKSDVMKHEVKAAIQDEYTPENIGLVLHQFFCDQVQSLAYCKQMHMLRWTRICKDSKTTEALYPEYQKRLKYIMEEYEDAIYRSKRLAACRNISDANASLSVVTKEDLEIYTRWLICHQHSVKHINSFLKVLEWLPTSRLSSVFPDAKKEEKMEDSKSQNVLRTLTRKLSTVGKANSLLKQSRPTLADSSIPTAPDLSVTSHKPLVSNFTINAIAAATGGGLASNEVTLSLPLNETNLDSYASLLNHLLNCYSIDMQSNDVQNRSDEMDMLHLVLRKFKGAHFKQEQMRQFPIYDFNKEGIDTKLRDDDTITTFKKRCNWLEFIQISPRVDSVHFKALTTLKQKNFVDELLRVHSQFMHVSESQKVLSCLREHSKCVNSTNQSLPFSVSTHKTGNDTIALWNKIFDYSNRRKNLKQKKKPLNFEMKLTSEDIAGVNDSELDLSAAVEMLGLEDDDQRKHPLSNQGTYLAFLVVRHLRIRDLQRTCLGTLNYFRSIERTLTIDDGGLISNEDSFQLKKHNPEDRNSSAGIGSHQYVHNTPTDFRMDQNEFIDTLEVENHDDFYIYENGRIYVQDQQGYYILYDASLSDFTELEHELLLVGSHFISKHKDPKKDRKKRSHANDFNLSDYSNEEVDRFGVLLDLWTNEALFLENKRKLLSCYMELYQHVFHPKEKRNIAQAMVDLMHKRPRYDFKASYLVETYRSECQCLRVQLGLIEAVANKQIDDQREYIQKTNRSRESEFGMPLRIIPLQNICLDQNRSALRYVYFLEFHPSLSLVCQVITALKRVLEEFVHIQKPQDSNSMISLERRLYEVALDEFQKMPSLGQDYTLQIQRDVFSDTFIEDPLLVCNFGLSTMSLMDLKGRKSAKVEKLKLLTFWCQILQVISTRHRLIESCHESGILSHIYRKTAKELGFDDCHLFMRAVSFEFAQRKSEMETRPISTVELLQNDGWIDRYTPNALTLAVHELDEKHIGTFSLRTQEGLLQVFKDNSVDRLKTTLACQVSHKNLLAAAVLKMDNCLTSEKKEDAQKSKNTKSQGDWHRRAQESFTSVQLEKVFLRNRMLNDYLDEKASKGIAMNNVEEVIKVKRKMIESFCLNLQERSAQHCMKAQIVEYTSCLYDLLAEFPRTRDSHFVFGSGEEKKEDTADVQIDSTELRRRPSCMLSDDGKQLLNLWSIPHYKEVLRMGKSLRESHVNRHLTVNLHLVSLLHDICQYLCAHAKLGSSHARLGSKKLEFSCVTADWGGTEGIGAELREIQKQINKLERPSDPNLAVKYLTKKRDVMYLEFDVAVCQSVRKNFLHTGNEKAFHSISKCMLFALKDMSNTNSPSVYASGLPLPEPLSPDDKKAAEIYPWRTFLTRYGPFPLMNKPFYNAGLNMQNCLAGLDDVDRHVVNGEILSLSLLLEDVLMFGPPNMSLEADEDANQQQLPTSSASKRSISISSGKRMQSKQADKQADKSKVWHWEDSLKSVEFLHSFLLLYSKLEKAKDDWACRKLGIPSFTTTKSYCNFITLYKTEVLQLVFKQIQAARGKEDDANNNIIDDNEPLTFPEDAGEYEIKARQLRRLLESLECSMINAVIRRISREHTLVVAEKGREDSNLPTDLWKKASMKESMSLARPHIVEDFMQLLMSDHLESHDNISFNKGHLEKSLLKLASSVFQRERLNFNNYSSFYENILRQQNQTLYMKEQEIIKEKNDSQLSTTDQSVEVDCLLAEKCHSLLIEVTALRARISEMAQIIRNQEADVREQCKQEYNSLTMELFNNAFGMKNRFEQFRSCLYDDVFNCLGEVRKLAVESMKKIREKSGRAEVDMNTLSQRLVRAEQLREAQWESKNLLNMILKLKALAYWNKTKNSTKFEFELKKLREDVTRTKKECLESNLMQEEKDCLLKQEVVSLRKALSDSERECHALRKKLANEQKIKMQKSNSQLQEALSQKKTDMAKSANIDKLITKLEEREEKLRLLSEMNARENSVSRRSKVESKKALKYATNQLQHERNLKLDAFERCGDLQKQVEVYEEHLELVTRPTSSQSHHAACFPAVPGGRTSPQRALVSARPHTQASGKTYQLGKTKQMQYNQPLMGWSYPNTNFNNAEGHPALPSSRGVPRSVTSRLRKKISETLLTDIDPSDIM